MNVFILSPSSLRVLHVRVQDYLNKRGIPVWMDTVNDGRDYQDQLADWLRNSDLIVILANKDYFACDFYQTEWDIAAKCTSPKLVVRLDDVNLPALTSSFVVKDCPSSEAIPEVIFQYLDGKRRAKLFVSYSREDIEAKNTLTKMIASSLNRGWVDESGIKPGDEFPDRILQAIDDCDYLLLLWSINSRNSRWVEKEWNHAFKFDKIIIPILLDSTPLPMVLEGIHSFQSLDDPSLYEFLEISSERVRDHRPD